ncbi:hypothetical protein D3C74_420080 [compost metagenome]
MSAKSKIIFKLSCNNNECYIFFLYEQGIKRQSEIPVHVLEDAIEESNRFIDFYYVKKSKNNSSFTPSRKVEVQNRANIKYFEISQANLLSENHIIENGTFSLLIHRIEPNEI